MFGVEESMYNKLGLKARHCEECSKVLVTPSSLSHADVELLETKS